MRHRLHITSALHQHSHSSSNKGTLGVGLVIVREVMMIIIAMIWGGERYSLTRTMKETMYAWMMHCMCDVCVLLCTCFLPVHGIIIRTSYSIFSLSSPFPPPPSHLVVSLFLSLFNSCLGCKVGFEKNRVKEKENWMKALHSKHPPTGLKGKSLIEKKEAAEERKKTWKMTMTCTHVP